MIRLLAYLLLILSLVAAYWYMVRPLLKARPALADFYAVEQSWWNAIWLKLNSIKTKLTAVLLIIASGMVQLHDVIVPLATGIDFSPITGKVPPWVWPIVTMGQAGLFYWLRQVTANAQDKKLAAVEAGVITARDAIAGTNPLAEADVRAMKTPAVTPGEKE